MKLELPRQISEKYSNIKFQENGPSGSRVVPCGQTGTTKLIVAFRNFANAPNKNSETLAYPTQMFRTICAVYPSLRFRCPDTETPRGLQAVRLLCFRLHSNRNSQGIQTWSALTKFTAINKCQRYFREFCTSRFSRQGSNCSV
jgi:hypothetical protein